MLRFVRGLVLCSLVLAPVFACGGSLDPDQIAFSSDRDGDGEVFVMDADGRNVRQLTNNDDYDSFPSWSPDGKQIAFSSDRYGDWEIFVMDADGATVRQLTQKGVQPRYKP